eukprot:TRINITY_DN3213_c0_g1_i3.p1 TRINITY_DN3213_c0_g1~~TRINITY_DN3213_c0_g1_i3.p1  ORF type:complete len:113 (-),score=15.12 TRINITY_DN3213_c0_g1_i3:548-886(-)
MKLCSISYGVVLGAIVQNWKRRFFVLTDKALYYYEDHESAKPKGLIMLSKECGVRRAESGDVPFLFIIRTPGRVYYLQGENVDDVHGWIGSIGGCIVRPSTRAYYDVDNPDN